MGLIMGLQEPEPSRMKVAKVATFDSPAVDNLKSIVREGTEGGSVKKRIFSNAKTSQ
jgi:hypothetical protein